MSTTFGVRVSPLSGEDDEIFEVAYRSSYVVWLHPLAQLLPDELEVESLDNSPQGIYTIGDIRKAIDDNGV